MLIYNNLNELKQLILDSYQLSDTEIEKMRNHVNNYYEKNMTPIAVVQSIEKNTSTKLFLMAEYGSVKYLEDRVPVKA